MSRKIGFAAALLLAGLLTGCVAYPEAGYYPAPYYAPAYAVAAPPVVGFWGGGRHGHDGGWGRGWGGGRHWR
jgi:hypothetical protein